MENKEIKIGNIDVYKWIKGIQASVLIVLGAIFIITSLLVDNQDIVAAALSIAVGVIFAVYGVLNIFSGYALYRTPMNVDIFSGTLSIAFAIVLFVNHSVLLDIFTLFVSGFIFVYSIIIIIYGLDKILGKEKNVLFGVLAFIVAALLIAAGVLYLYFFYNRTDDVKKYMLLICGVAITVVGIVSLANFFVKLHNTNRYLKEEKEKKKTKKKKWQPLLKKKKMLELSTFLNSRRTLAKSKIVRVLKAKKSLLLKRKTNDICHDIKSCLFYLSCRFLLCSRPYWSR